MPRTTISLYDDDHERTLAFEVSGPVNGGCPETWITPGEPPFVEDWTADRCIEIDLHFPGFVVPHEPSPESSARLCRWLMDKDQRERWGETILEELNAELRREMDAA